jgi:hypothetical protein
MRCGFDLARRRPSREPHYGLRIITCPSCGVSAVRRMHPIWTGWRTFLRLKSSLLALAFQVVCLAILTAWFAIFAAIAGERLVEGLRGPREVLVFQAAACLGAAVGAGIWLTVGLSHWRRWVAFSAWTIWIAVVLSIPPLAGLADHALAEATGRAATWRVEPQVWAGGLAAAACMSAVGAALGIPLGLMILKAHQSHRRYRWRARRRRLRKRRMTA